MDRFVLIHHPQTGERYAVTVANWERLKRTSYRGFRATVYEDTGEPYAPPAKRTPKEG